MNEIMTAEIQSNNHIKKPEDFWSTVEQDELGEREHLQITTAGIKIFRVEREYPVKRELNDYTYSSKKYNHAMYKEPGKTEEYQVRDLDIVIKYWNGKLIYSRARVTISERVWKKIKYSVRGLQNLCVDVPSWIIYWKKSKQSVWFAFINDDQFSTIISQLIEYENGDRRDKEIYREVSQIVPWEGWKTHIPYSFFKGWYGIK